MPVGGADDAVTGIEPAPRSTAGRPGGGPDTNPAAATLPRVEPEPKREVQAGRTVASNHTRVETSPKREEEEEEREEER